MIMNYNDWFHKYHQYLTGKRDGVETFNDTKWKYINDRYQKLIDLNSQLISKQPYGVVGNYTGFQQLTSLMEQSNYTFEDLNESLIETYRMSLQNAMSRMLVNTHAVIASYWNYDEKHVFHDNSNSRYYIIDVPFDQMHFGDRDRFIRDKLHQMYETESKHYIPADEFLSDQISKTIGFTILCTTNGFLSDDWAVGVDDKGFHFKIGWQRVEDVKFGIYKLDASRVLTCEMNTQQFVSNHTIPLELFNVNDIKIWIGCKCIVQFTDQTLRKDLQICPNFGMITSDGLKVINLQQKTLNDLSLFRSQNAHVRVYVIQYLHELPNVYPALNYYDMLGSRYVYDSKYNHITNDDGGYIRTQDSIVENTHDVCTPPISLDHKSVDAFYIIRDCYNMIQSLRGMNDTVLQIGNACNIPPTSFNTAYAQLSITGPAMDVYNQLMEHYQVYLSCAILTSLIPSADIQLFESICEKFKTLADSELTYNTIQKNLFDELFGNNFLIFVDKIVSPFASEPFTTLGMILSDKPDYFESEPETRFNRPIAEQCFIVLKYNKYESCWVFDQPTIKHFNGIENTFYINSDLNGDEVYKFFVLYTDTENPHELETSSLTFEECVDFDLFQKEVTQHLGYIRYWHVENRLAKLSQLYYQRHDSESKVNILSKILKQKIDDDTFLDYPSMMNFEPSNVTSDHVDAGEYDIRAPFALNFLFYTVSMLFDNKDQLLTYFMYMLTEKEFSPRYRDLKLSEIPNELVSEPINFSIISNAPNTLESGDIANCSFPDTTDVTLYSGIPFPIDGNHNPIPHGSSDTYYPFTFNQYQDNQSHVYLTKHGVDPSYYVRFANIAQRGYRKITFSDDVRLANMITIYLAELYNGMNDLITNYTSIWNQTTVIKSMKRVMEKHAARIQSYVSSRGDDFQPHHPDTQTILDAFSNIDENVLYEKLENLLSEYDVMSIYRDPFNPSKRYNIINIVNAILNLMQKVYDLTGFDHEATRRIRRVYIQLKQLNTPMSLHQFKEWVSDLDLDMLLEIGNHYSDNPNVLYTKTMFTAYTPMLRTLIQNAPFHIASIQSIIDDLNTTVFTEYLNTLITYCDDIVASHVNDMYILKPITLDTPISVNQKPSYAAIQIASNDAHVSLRDITPSVDNYILYFYPKFERTATGYEIIALIPVCTYSFFDGTGMSAQCIIYNGSNQSISTQIIQLSFQQVSTSADQSSTQFMYVNTQSVSLPVQNIHETFDVFNNGAVLNERHSNMYYELLVGNRFLPISKFMEDTSPDRMQLQGPIDQLYLSCNQMNQFIAEEQNKHVKCGMFFKACQIMHIEPIDDVITSIGGKYRVGEKIYIATNDGLSVFPAIITAIDHSEARGFIEAKVDEFYAKWFHTTDATVMHQYLTELIPCTVLDDNLSNFMDEYASYTGQMYTVPELSSTVYHDPEHETAYTLPGDPLYVSQHQDYVYTRLSRLFSDDIPNTIDDDVSHHFVYIGSGTSVANESRITINMIHHDFNTLTNQELYPILRDEPDDHDVWRKERETFSSEISKAIERGNQLAATIQGLTRAMQFATTDAERQALRIRKEDAELKQLYYANYEQQLRVWIEQLEIPSTWYNVLSYDAALVYINNGRAHITKTFRPNIRDIAYTDNIEVKLYDWEHKTWIDPSAYTVTSQIENQIQIDDHVDTLTNDVLTTLQIQFNDTSFSSKRILIYFVYDSSTVFDDIQLHDMNCDVRFRPVLSLPSISSDHASTNPYDFIRVRKHFESKETYAIKSLDDIDVFPNGKYLKRYAPSGKYTTGSTIRFGDLELIDGNQSYDISSFDVYVKHPLAPNEMPQTRVTESYTASVIQPIDGFDTGYHFTLISIGNQDDMKYDGVSSNIMFDAMTTSEGTIKILESTVHPSEPTSYLCYVNPDTTHPMSGGIVRVNVNASKTNINVPYGWIKLPDDIRYRMIPDECVLVPKSPLQFTDTMVLQLQTQYTSNHDVDVSIDQTNPDDPYVYYYDLSHEVRYPIGDTRHNSIQRFVIDRSLNPDVKMIRATHIGVCRYAVAVYPENGIIDLTGYIPTPLSRDRYEFWVNGRYVADPDQIVILSPTTFQLRNMRSLHNLEVIELVDDLPDQSMLMKKDHVYIDINGHVYGSYELMKKSNANIMNQNIQYAFYQNLHDYIDTYVNDVMRVSHNIDVEPDILQYIQTDDTSISSYNELYHIPTINGVSIYHATTTALGFMELPHSIINDKLDLTWKKERLMGVMNLSHSSGYRSMNSGSQHLHIQKNDTGYNVYTTGSNEYAFTLYITPNQTDSIDMSVKIIPMIRSGVTVELDHSYDGMWIHSTVEKTNPIQIQ